MERKVTDKGPKLFVWEAYEYCRSTAFVVCYCTLLLYSVHSIQITFSDPHCLHCHIVTYSHVASHSSTLLIGYHEPMHPPRPLFSFQSTIRHSNTTDFAMKCR